MQHCAFMILPRSPFPSSIKYTNYFCSFEKIYTNLFLWSALESCLVSKLYTQRKQYIERYAQVVLQCLDSQERAEFEFCVWFMYYAHASMFTSCDEKCILSTMGTLCYELWNTVLFIINILYMPHAVRSLREMDHGCLSCHLIAPLPLIRTLL